MKKKNLVVFIIILTLINLKGMAQDITQFKKEIQGNTLQLIVNRKAETTVFETQLLSKEKGTLVLNKFESNSYLLSDKNKYQFFNIIDFSVKGHFLYVFYNDFGKIFMDRYALDDKSPSAQKRFLIGNYKIISYENGGDMESYCQAKWIDDKLYFYIDAKQAYGGRLNGLFVFVEPQKNIKKISFSEPSKTIDGNGFFHSLNIEDSGGKVQKELLRLLVENKVTDANSFSFLGYLEHPLSYHAFNKYKVRDVENLYLFYRTGVAGVKIIRYDNNENLWLFSDVKEEEIPN